MEYRLGNSNEQLKHAPLWLRVAAVLVVSQALILFGFDPTFGTGVTIPSALLFVLFMMRGSRIAWVVVLTGLVSQLILAAVGEGQPWTLVFDGIASMCLLLPESIRFIWFPAETRGSVSAGAVETNQNAPPWKPNLPKPGHSVREISRSLIAWVAGWQDQDLDDGVRQAPRSFKLLIWRLVICCVVMIGLVGLTYEWQHGPGKGDLFVDVIARISWNLYLLAQIAFIAAVVVAISRRSKG